MGRSRSSRECSVSSEFRSKGHGRCELPIPCGVCVVLFDTLLTPPPLLLLGLAAAVEGRRHGALVGVHEGRSSIPNDLQGGSTSARSRGAAQGVRVGAVEDSGYGKSAQCYNRNTSTIALVQAGHLLL